VALGHIHKPQNLDEGGHHPVIYPGSIERVDFGEAADDKFYVIADVKKDGKTQVEWQKLSGRRFIDRFVRLETPADFDEKLKAAMPSEDQLVDAVVRLVVEYPFEYESLLDEAALRKQGEVCLEFHLVRRPQRETRIRLPQDQTISSLSALDLLDVYWRSVNSDDSETEELQKLAAEVIQSANGGSKSESEA